jgi:hypothetical protein
LPANAPVAGASNRNIEAEHVIECQMLARTIYSNQHPEMRLLLQNMTIREPLKRQPQLIENAFRAIYSVHNEVGNLLWTTYDVNMWKKQCVQTMLEELDCNAHCERSFANSLHDQVCTTFQVFFALFLAFFACFVEIKFDIVIEFLCIHRLYVCTAMLTSEPYLRSPTEWLAR